MHKHTPSSHTQAHLYSPSHSLPSPQLPGNMVWMAARADATVKSKALLDVLH